MPKKIFTQAECEQWELNKAKNSATPKNPQTNYKVQNGSLTYKNIDKECAKYKNEAQQVPSSEIAKPSPIKKKVKPQGPKGLLSRPLTLEDCLYWKKHNKKNPITKYTLADNSKILKEVKKQCEPLLKTVPAKQSPSRSPKSSPKSPKSLSPKLTSKSLPKLTPKSSPKSPKSPKLPIRKSHKPANAP